MAKQVTDREGSAEAVAAAAETHAERVNEAFARRFARFLTKKEKDSSQSPNVGLALMLVARALRESSHTLVEASRAHDRELADDAAPREARDAAAAEIIRKMVGIRATIENVYGKAGLKAFGIDGRTPTDTKAVLEHARGFLAHLEEPKRKWPKHVMEGVTVDPKVWVAQLKGPVATLEAARKDVAREEREAQVTGDAKAKAMAYHDDLFAGGAGFISAALGIVGDWELAEKTRPSQRRAGATAEQDEEVTAPENELPTEAAAPAPTEG